VDKIRAKGRVWAGVDAQRIGLVSWTHLGGPEGCERTLPRSFAEMGSEYDGGITIEVRNDLA